MTRDGWTRCKLGDLLEIRHGYAFEGEYFGDAGSHVVVTPGNFFDEGGFKTKGEKEKWYSGPVPEAYVLDEGALIVAMTEQAEGLLGSSAIVPREGFYLHNQRIGLVVTRDNTASDRRFLYYLFNTKDVRQQIRASATGVKIRHTAPSRIASVAADVPGIRTQRRIASVLSTYDDLIDNNQRRIRILEEMARALYREWFVHIRFPGHGGVKRVASKLGPIPRGWSVHRLGDIAEQMRRNVPTGALDEPRPFVGLEHIPRRSLALDSWAMVADLGSSKLAFERDEVLFGKIRPYFHKVSVAPFDGICSADTIVLRARQPADYAVVVACVSSDEFVAHASATANGAKMPRADWAVLAEYPVVVPVGEPADRFAEFLRSALREQQVLVAQIATLRRARDLLLPRLLSGRISLETAEPAA